MKKLLFPFLLLIIVSSTKILSAQAWGYNNNRIAISADGNNQADYEHKWPRADPDDWGGTPAALAMIAKTGLYNQLVHFSYNNFIDSHPHTTDINQMKIGIDGAIERWNFDASRFFDVTEQLEAAKADLKEEIVKSTAQDPLYFIHMGPAEFFYQVIKDVVDAGQEDALSHVYIVSHSGYNDEHLRRDYHHTIPEAITLSGNRLKYKRIQDQNGTWDPNLLWSSGSDYSVWFWMRDHCDPNVKWMFSRMKSGGKADVSDAGMLYWLIIGDENGSPSKFKRFIGNGIPKAGAPSVTGIKADVSELLVFTGKSNRIIAKIVPVEAFGKKINWNSSDTTVATVENGEVFGIKSGIVNITATTTEGLFKAITKVIVEDLPTCKGEISLNALSDFENLEIGNFAPAYKDHQRGAVAINAELYKDVFAAASAKFKGEKGLYDVTINSLKELDGESTYRLKIGGRLVGSFKNSPTNTDYDEQYFTIKDVSIRNGETIQIEFNSASNKKVPEGDGYAYARGRWKSIDFNCVSERNEQDEQELLSFEAENFKLKGAWKTVGDATVSDGRYIVYNGQNNYNSPDLAHEISYNFQINSPGTYTVKWFMRQPMEADGDKSNDVWIYFDGNYGFAGEHRLEHYEKYYGRSKEVFGLNGIAEVHDVGHKWLSVKFPKPGTYTIKLSGRSEFLQIDRFILFKGMTLEEAEAKATQVE